VSGAVLAAVMMVVAAVMMVVLAVVMTSRIVGAVLGDGDPGASHGDGERDRERCGDACEKLHFNLLTRASAVRRMTP
jgi:hypothetical protein